MLRLPDARRGRTPRGETPCKPVFLQVGRTGNARHRGASARLNAYVHVPRRSSCATIVQLLQLQASLRQVLTDPLQLWPGRKEVASVSSHQDFGLQIRGQATV